MSDDERFNITVPTGTITNVTADYAAAYINVDIHEFRWSIEEFGQCDGLNSRQENATVRSTDWEPPDPPGWEGGFAENH